MDAKEVFSMLKGHYANTYVVYTVIEQALELAKAELEKSRRIIRGEF